MFSSWKKIFDFACSFPQEKNKKKTQTPSSGLWWLSCTSLQSLHSLHRPLHLFQTHPSSLVTPSIIMELLKLSFYFMIYLFSITVFLFSNASSANSVSSPFKTILNIYFFIFFNQITEELINTSLAAVWITFWNQCCLSCDQDHWGLNLWLGAAASVPVCGSATYVQKKKKKVQHRRQVWVLMLIVWKKKKVAKLLYNTAVCFTLTQPLSYWSPQAFFLKPN